MVFVITMHIVMHHYYDVIGLNYDVDIIRHTSLMSQFPIVVSQGHYDVQHYNIKIHGLLSECTLWCSITTTSYFTIEVIIEMMMHTIMCSQFINVTSQWELWFTTLYVIIHGCDVTEVDMMRHDYDFIGCHCVVRVDIMIYTATSHSSWLCRQNVYHEAHYDILIYGWDITMLIIPHEVTIFDCDINIVIMMTTLLCQIS